MNVNTVLRKDMWYGCRGMEARRFYAQAADQKKTTRRGDQEARQGGCLQEMVKDLTDNAKARGRETMGKGELEVVDTRSAVKGVGNISQKQKNGSPTAEG